VLEVAAAEEVDAEHALGLQSVTKIYIEEWS
jgi:hypothetical protein